MPREQLTRTSAFVATLDRDLQSVTIAGGDRLTGADREFIRNILNRPTKIEGQAQ